MKWYVRSGAIRAVVAAPTAEEALIRAFIAQIKAYQKGDSGPIDRLYSAYSDLGYVSIVNEHGFDVREEDVRVDTGSALMKALKRMRAKRS